MPRLLALLAFLLLPSLCLAQGYPRDYFRSPLGIPLSLSGNFAEMRSNHFHGGLDIRTNGQTGYRVYAAAPGFVSRVVVSGGGYGNALYVQHPNGYTTVYGHLERFEEPIASWVRAAQYRDQSFEVNLFPEAGQFPFTQGAVIAYSGNSGSSGGPHLHFEIRDSGTSEPLNPLLFGLPVVDTVAPTIMRINVYVADAVSAARIVSASGDTLATARPDQPAGVPVIRRPDGSYALDRGAKIVARGKIAFAIQAQDAHDGSRSRLGLYSISLRAGEQEIYRSTLERINFATQRYINAHLDYAERVLHSRWMQRSHVIPGNPLPIYQAARRGYLDVRPGDRTRMTYAVQDAYLNAATVSFDLEGADLKVPASRALGGYLVRHNQPESFVMPGLIVRFPRGALYDDTEILYSVSDRPSNAFSPVHRLHRDSTPIHNAITISLEADALPARLRSKALLASVGTGGRLSSIGGGWENGYVTAQTRGFGSFVVAADSIPPVITPVNIRQGANMSREASIRLKISDNLSGVSSFDGRIDGQWVLFDYDPKNSLISHTFDGRVAAGAHELVIRVTDGKGNLARYEVSFTR